MQNFFFHDFFEFRAANSFLVRVANFAVKWWIEAATSPVTLFKLDRDQSLFHKPNLFVGSVIYVPCAMGADQDDTRIKNTLDKAKTKQLQNLSLPRTAKTMRDLRLDGRLRAIMA